MKILKKINKLIFFPALMIILLGSMPSCDDSLGAEENVRMTPDYFPEDSVKSVLANTKWKLIRYENDQANTFDSLKLDIESFSLYVFTINFEDSVNAWGRSGCNDYTCMYSEDGNKINIKDYHTTYYECPLTQTYEIALQDVYEFRVFSDSLELITYNPILHKMYFYKNAD